MPTPNQQQNEKVCVHDFQLLKRKSGKLDPLRAECTKCHLMQETNPYTGEVRDMRPEEAINFKKVWIVDELPTEEVTLTYNPITEDWEKKFDTHFFGTDRSTDKSIENESVRVYAVKRFIASLISDAEQKARDSERNKIFAILRYLEIPHAAKEIMKVYKEWESSRLSLQDNHQSE